MLEDKVREQFLTKGYKEVSNYRMPANLLWRPSLVFSKNGFTYLILVKSNNSIPQSFLDRIAKIPSKKIIPVIVFAQRLKNKTEEKLILSLGISFAYYLRGKIVNEKIRQKRSTHLVKQDIKKKLRVIDIFISSKQDIRERKLIEEIVNKEREVNSYPFNPPRRIEYARFGIKGIYRYIDKSIGICEWVIILLEDNKSPYVKYEINKSIKTKRPENIFLFVKSTKKCQTVWQKQLNKIKLMNSIHYVTYSTFSELEVRLRIAIKTQMEKIYRKHKIEA